MTLALRRKLRFANTRLREWRMIAKGLASKRHPILAHLIPIRRCNLSCTYCNEFDNFSKPVALEQMFERVDKLAALGTTIVTISGGEPLLHPHLEEIVQRIRRHGILAGMITNGYLLTPQRIEHLNRAGLDHLQISIDNVQPDDVSKKSLKVLDRKLQMLAQYAIFQVNINSVLGSPVKNPDDAVVVARRALELGFTSTVGILHDHDGQLQPLGDHQQKLFAQIMQMGKRSYARFNQFQKNISHGLRQRLAMPRRQPLPLHLRRRPGALLLAAARISRPSRWRNTRASILLTSTTPRRLVHRTAPSPACTRWACWIIGARPKPAPRLSPSKICSHFPIT